MRKVLLVHYFYDVDFFIPLIQELRALLYSVETFGLFGAKEASTGYFRELMDKVRSNDIVFFWTNILTRDQMKCLRLCFPRKLFVRYTWYAIEPYNHMEREYFDLYFSSTHGFGMYLPPAVDTRHFRPRVGVQKELDVAVYAHNIFIERERALETLRHTELRIGLFGNAAVGEMYPELYRGEVSYEAMPESIASAHIVLVLNCSPYNCITDTFFKALSCGALVLTNVNKAPFYGRCMVVDESRIVEQVRELLQEDNSIMQQRARTIAKQFDWNRFVERIHVKIAEKLFDCDFYVKTFEHSFPRDTLPDAVFEYWRFYGLPQLEVPFAFDVPEDDRPRIAHLRRDSLFSNKSDPYLCWYLRAGTHDASTPTESTEIPQHIHQSLEAIFHGTPLTTLRTDPHINYHVQSFFTNK